LAALKLIQETLELTGNSRLRTVATLPTLGLELIDDCLKLTRQAF